MQIDNDRGLSDLIKPDSERLLCEGFDFTEGAVWIEDGGYLLFSDIPGDTIHRYDPGTGAATVYRRPSRKTNGNTLDNQGRLLSCEHSGRRVSIATLGSPEETLTDNYQGKRYNSPNDVAVHSNGWIFFTDPTYGITPPGATRMGDPTGVRELDFQGVYRVDPDGKVTLVLQHFSQPNGLVFSPDESILYVGDSQDRIIRRYRVQDDGTLTDETLFVDMRGDQRRGSPDGMRVDADGRLWSTGAGGVWVVQPDGAVLGQVETETHAANLRFGGPDRTTLYLCAGPALRSLDTNVRGIR